MVFFAYCGCGQVQVQVPPSLALSNLGQAFGCVVWGRGRCVKLGERSTILQDACDE